jgi:hypothetical protein
MTEFFFIESHNYSTFVPKHKIRINDNRLIHGLFHIAFDIDPVREITDLQ